MANQKRFSVFKLIIFILSLVAIALFAYGMLMQPVFKGTGEEKYLDYYKTIIDNFPDLLKSTAKDKLFGIILLAVLLVLLGGAALFTGVATLVVFISGLVSLFSKHRIKAGWLLAAGAFHLSFISVMIAYYFPLEKVELGLGGLLIVAAYGLGVLIYALEDYFCGNNKTARRLIGTLARIVISGGFIYVSLFCFTDLYRVAGESEGFGQCLFSDFIYLSRIEEDLPKKLFAFIAVATFVMGLIINVLVPMLPAICGSRSMAEKYTPKNRNKKFIVQSVVMAILLACSYFGTVYITDNPSNYTFGAGLLLMEAVFVVAFALSIVMAIVDPKTKNIPQTGQPIYPASSQPVRNVSSQPQNNSQSTKDNAVLYVSEEAPKTTDNNPDDDEK